MDDFKTVVEVLNRIIAEIQASLKNGPAEALLEKIEEAKEMIHRLEQLSDGEIQDDIVSNRRLSILTLEKKLESKKSAARSSKRNAEGAPVEGLLSHYGYRVGESSGVSPAKRREILDTIYYLKTMPRGFSQIYIDKWGGSASTERLKKMAEVIAQLCRNAKAKATGHEFDQAISDWEADLEYLYEEYFKDRHQFTWPHTL